jgi:hypothetical protein
LEHERKLRKELEAKLSGDRETSPDSKGSRRRRRSRERPRLEGQPLEAIDWDAKPVEPDWKAIEDVLARHAKDTSTDKRAFDSTYLAEEVGQFQADEKWDERRKPRNKHRLLLFACQAVDPSLEVCEDKGQGTWSSAATRPVSGWKVIPPRPSHLYVATFCHKVSCRTSG